MTLYQHVLQVVVLTPVCSSDTIITAVEAVLLSGPAVATVWQVDAQNRAAIPFMRVPDPPVWPGEAHPEQVAAYWSAYDHWADALPGVEDFREDGKA